MRIINSDGSEANMCGSAIRCFAKLVYEAGMIQKDSFTIETYAGTIIPELITENGSVKAVRVNMGEPRLTRVDIPMRGKKSSTVINQPLKVGRKTFHITSLLMGVPHTMVFVDDLDQTDVVTIGRQIEKSPIFPKETNVNFVQVIMTGPATNVFSGEIEI